MRDGLFVFTEEVSVAYPPELRSRAEKLFVEEGKTLREIAEIYSVGYNTLGKWAARGRWRKKQAEHRGLMRNRIDKLNRVIDAKLDEILDLPAQETVGLIRELTGLLKAAEDMRKVYRPYEVMVYAEEWLVPFINQKCPDKEFRDQFFHWLKLGTSAALEAQER